MKPIVFLHRWQGNDAETRSRSEDIAAELDEALSDSGLAAAAEIHSLAPPSKSEIGTLAWLHYRTRDVVPETPILYLHVKGASWLPGKPETACVDDWRQLMTHFCVTRWESALRALDAPGVRAVGCNLSTARGRPHFSGNFWWAKAGAVRALPIPEYSWDRMEGEFWIGGVGVEHMGSLHQSGVDHYFVRYPREMYAS